VLSTALFLLYTVYHLIFEQMKSGILSIILLFSFYRHEAGAQTIRAISPDSVLNIINDYPDSGLVVINFWATWCGPCVGELPYFIKADSLLKGENITFIFVSFDVPGKIQSVQKYLDKRKLPGAHYLINSADLNTFIDKVNKQWEGSIPYTIVLNQNDRKTHEGSFETFKDLWSFIREE